MTYTDLLTPMTWTTTGRDAYNNPVSGYTDGAPILGDLQQSGTSELYQGQDTLLSDWVAYLPAGTALSGADRLRDAQDRVFDVVGTPWEVTSLSGVPSHVQVHLRYHADAEHE